MDEHEEVGRREGRKVRLADFEEDRMKKEKEQTRRKGEAKLGSDRVRSARVFVV